jgi:hypothetical protein
MALEGPISRIAVRHCLEDWYGHDYTNVKSAVWVGLHRVMCLHGTNAI